MSVTVDQLETRMLQLSELRDGPGTPPGWGARLRRKFGHFTPDEYYEAVVDDLVGNETSWLDVGGGSAIFPSNAKLARTLADRCKRLVAVDPSSNVHENPYAHERFQGLLEEYNEPGKFTLATARMVVEHVAQPERFVGKLGQMVAPGGKAVVYTVNRWAPMTVLSGCTPMFVHHFAKKILWDTEEKDTFPVEYLMNTRARLNSLFSAAGFQESAFHRLDDCRTLKKWKVTMTAELTLWKVLRSAGMGYPESCLLGVYERTQTG